MFTPKIQKALEAAAYLHRNQVRKGDLGTMLIVMPYTDDEDVMCAALLHDVLEDIAESEFSSEAVIYGNKPARRFSIASLDGRYFAIFPGTSSKVE